MRLFVWPADYRLRALHDLSVKAANQIAAVILDEGFVRLPRILGWIVACPVHQILARVSRNANAHDAVHLVVRRLVV